MEGRALIRYFPSSILYPRVSKSSSSIHGFALHHKMGFLRPLFPYHFRSAFRSGGHGGGRARSPWLARLAHLLFNFDGHGLCADMRHGF